MAAAGFFLEVDGGRRFCLLEEAAGASPRGSLLHIHAFAEEMNKARPTVAQAARALAMDGWNVLRMDLLGCGDSSGDFGDATWSAWLADVHAGLDWLAVHHPGPAGLWGLRTGCLLAVQIAARRRLDAPLLLWQPVLSGRQYLNQFLRLKVAGEMLAEASQRSTTAALRQGLLDGAALEVAGYGLAPDLARGMDDAELACPGTNVDDIAWIEVAAREDPQLLPGSQARVRQWGEVGARVRAAAVSGPAFWQSVEIEHCPALVAATVQALRGPAA